MKNRNACTNLREKYVESSNSNSARATIRIGRKHSAALVISCALGTFSLNASAAAYTFTILNPTVGLSSTVYALNNSGQSVGYSQIGTSGANRASLWSGTGYDLGTLGGANSEAHAINDAGLIVGWGNQPSGPGFARAILWDGTSAIDLGTLGGIASYATGINIGGTIAGASYTTGDALHAARWTGTSVEDLGTLGGNESWAQAVNDSGTIVGQSQILTGSGSSATVHAAKWVGTTVTDLGTLGGANSSAISINNQGQAVGHSQASNDIFRATLWDGTEIVDLGTLGGASSVAYDINNIRQIVGSSALPGERVAHATLWESGKIIDLNDRLDSAAKSSGWTLESALSINDSGWIVGAARNGYTDTLQAYMLSVSTVPEPNSIALLLVGIGAIATKRVRGVAASTS